MRRWVRESERVCSRSQMKEALMFVQWSIVRCVRVERGVLVVA